MRLAEQIYEAQQRLKSMQKKYDEGQYTISQAQSVYLETARRASMQPSFISYLDLKLAAFDQAYAQQRLPLLKLELEMLESNHNKLAALISEQLKFISELNKQSTELSLDKNPDVADNASHKLFRRW